MPVHQNLVHATRQDALQVTRGDLALTVCHECGFVFNSAFDGAKLMYGADYDNTQYHSPFFKQYVSDLATHLVNEKGVRNCRVVEVGCGKGFFLRVLLADASSGNTGIGFDPSYVGPEDDLDGKLRFERRFYDDACATIPADVVVCRHVIEHVPQPLELLCSVRQGLCNETSPRIYFETPCLEWILRHQVIWDFFYEHCSLFTAASLRTAFEYSGFSVHDVHHVFGGQYLWLEAGLATDDHVSSSAGNIPLLASNFAAEASRLCNEWQTRLNSLREQGKIAIWGAGAKGTTFAHLVDPENQLIDCLIDLNPNKQGRFVSGTGHPIVGVEALAARDVRNAILMNPNYRAENEAILASYGITIQLIE